VGLRPAPSSAPRLPRHPITLPALMAIMTRPARAANTRQPVWDPYIGAYRRGPRVLVCP
jgi:hypothetical protein